MNLDFEIDDGGLDLLLTIADPKVRAEAPKLVRENSLLVEGVIKQDMPVDTGRARASWGHWSPGDLTNASEAYQDGANEGDAVWEESPDGMTVTQGTNLPYVQDLNEGSSQQMGAGFIEDAAQLGAVTLIDDIEKLVGRIL